MYFNSEKLIKANILEKQIWSACNYSGAKVEFFSGNIISIETTNICFIEPHKAIIKIKDIKLILLFYDDDNLFLFDRHNPLKISELKKLINNIRLGLVNDN